MKKPLSEEGIVAAVADAAAKRICRRTIRHFQAIKAELSGDDSGLATVWDEICVQIQDESSILWECYDTDVRPVVLELLSEIPAYEKDALWLRTDAGVDWTLSDPEDRMSDPEIDLPIIEHLLSDYIYREAGQWSNLQIRAYLNRAAMRD